MGEKAYREALHKILDLCLDINGMQKSKSKNTGNHPTVFMELAGHVATITVRVFDNGWASGRDSDTRLECGFSNDNSYDTPVQVAEKLEKYKEELIGNNAL